MYQPWHGRTISYRDLPPAEPGSQLAVEWDFYRQEVGRLLADGHAGKHVLIKGAEIIGIYETHEEALGEGYRRFSRHQPFLIHEIQAEERVYLNTWRFRGWPRKVTQ
jgi:hypothetical protein